MKSRQALLAEFIGTLLLLTIVVGSGAFFGTAYLLRVAEIHDVVELIGRRFKRA